MTSNDELKLSDLFDSASDIQYKLETNQIEQDIRKFNDALERLKLAEERLDELHLFSDNEDISEVSTSELRYFIIYALIAWLYEYRVVNREERINDVKIAIHYFIKYLKLCQNYGLVKHIPNDEIDDSVSIRLCAPEDRHTKVQKMKEKKQLEQSIAKLREMTRDIHRIDDEIKRKLYTEQIQWWIRQAQDDISELKDECKLIQFSKTPSVPTNTNLHTVSTNRLPISGPFTLVTTKDRLYKEAVGGAGYPSVPTMSIQEFYDDLAKRQAQQPIIPPKREPQSDEILNEIDDPKYRESVRQMDEYKDDNPRGWGNRYNRS